ncbi:MAG: hypothetical protein H0V66_10560 [Bdellovibrionales bacterium]|nr:hypothetical protein [Bdellovibrionales bacterium]
MKKISIAFGVFLSGLVLTVLGLYLARNTIVHSLIVSTVEKELPGAQVQLKDIDVSLGNTLKVKLTGLSITHQNRPVVSLQDLSVNLPEILSRRTQGSADIKLAGMLMDLEQLNELEAKRKDHSSKKDQSNEKPFSVKDLKDIATFELNLSVTDVQLKHTENEVITTILIPEFNLQGAKLSSKFPAHAKLIVRQESKGQASLDYTVTQSGLIDFARFLDQEKAQLNISWIGNGSQDAKPLPELKATLRADLDLKGPSEANFNLRSPGAEVEVQLLADFQKETFSTQTFRADLNPAQILTTSKLDQNLRVNMQGKVKGTFDKADGNIDLTTTAFALTTPEGNSIAIGPSFHAATFELVLKGKSQANLISRYAQSYLNSEIILQDTKPITVKLDSEALAKDLAPLLAQVMPELSLKRSDTKLMLKADIDLTKTPLQARVSGKNAGDLQFTNKEGHTLLIQNLNLESTPLKNQQEFLASLQGSLTPAKLKPLAFRTELKGQVNDAGSADFKKEMMSGTFLLETAKDASRARAKFSMGENRFSLRNLDGLLLLQDFLPLLPPDTRSLFSPTMAKTTGFSLAGDVDYAEGKLKDSKLSLHLTEPLSLRKEANTIRIDKLALTSVPAKQEGVLALSLMLNGTLSSTLSQATAPLTHTSELQVDLQQTTKDKSPNVTSTHSTKIFKDSSFAFKLAMKEGVTKISELKGLVQLQELFPFVPSSLREMLAPLKNSKSQLLANGSLSLKENRFQNLKLELQTSAPIPVMAMEGVPAQLSFETSLTDVGTTTRATIALLQGQILVSAQGPGLKTTEVKPQTLFPREVKLKLDNLQVPRSLLQKTLHPKDQPVASKTAPKTNQDFTTLAAISEMDIELEPSRLVVEKNAFGMQGKFKLKKGQLRSQGLKLTSGQGAVAVEIVAKIEPKSLQAKVDTQITNFDLSTLSGFMPPVVEAVTGLAQGSVNADARLAGTDPVSYQVKYSLKAINGELKGINLTEQIGSLIQKLDFLGGGKDKQVVVSDKFKEFFASGTADEKTINFDTLRFSGIRNTLSLSGKGSVGQIGSKKKSELIFDLTDPAGKIGAALKENTGSDVLPVRLAGTEIDLSPDYQYTLGKVGKGAAKKSIEKQGKKILGDFLKKKGF